MRKLLLLLILFTACQNRKSLDDKSNSFADSLKIDIKARQMADSLINLSGKERLLDTTGISSSPVQIISSKFIEKEYSNYKNVKLVFKNISSKKIQAIKFEWYGENAFNEPANFPGSTIEGVSGGFTDDSVNPGKTKTSTWDVLSNDGKKILAARAYEVAFSDGTKWKLKQ